MAEVKRDLILLREGETHTADQDGALVIDDRHSHSDILRYVAADIGAVGPMVSKLIEGMAVALYTTLTGAVLSIWLMVNYRLLQSGVVNLLTAMVERVEANHGRA